VRVVLPVRSKRVSGRKKGGKGRKKRTRVDVSADSDVPHPSEPDEVLLLQLKLGRQGLNGRGLGRSLLIPPQTRDGERSSRLSGGGSEALRRAREGD
jgi:hypothetical protein